MAFSGYNQLNNYMVVKQIKALEKGREREDRGKILTHYQLEYHCIGLLVFYYLLAS